MTDSVESVNQNSSTLSNVELNGRDLHIEDVHQVSILQSFVQLSQDSSVIERIYKSRDVVKKTVEKGEPLYGVNTPFGGMANVQIPVEEVEALQNNLPWPHKTGAGGRLHDSDVRAAMLLRANSLMQGASGVRLELIQRFVDCLNAGFIPHVYEFGSIGASGDLVPLSYILGSVIGLDSAYKASFKGEAMDSVSALRQAGLAPLSLAPKEGLAVINGTSVMTGMAANCMYEAEVLLTMNLGAHALLFQGLGATNQSFQPVIHKYKPHPGQAWVADRMLRLLQGSDMIRDEQKGGSQCRDNGPIQDRYSLRCLPQYLGPIVENMAHIKGQIEVEMNSATDNPLIDPDQGCAFNCGNFLGQHIAMGMDHLRHCFGLLSKHLDVQIAMAVAPEFNNGLSASLVGNSERSTNIGLKGLQITANSMMPLLNFYGNSLADRFPTHAEQYNQNINSQGFGSAYLTRKSLDILQRYIAISLIFGVQSVDLRAKTQCGHYDARKLLSPSTLKIYDGVYKVTGVSPSSSSPYIWNDNEQSLDSYITLIAEDIIHGGLIKQAMKDSLARLRSFTRQ